MRRRLVMVAAAIATMVALAFLVPLGLIVRQTARDRAITQANRDAAALAPVLTLSTDAATLARAARSTRSGAEDRVTVYLDDRALIGTAPLDAGVARALASPRPITVPARGGIYTMTRVQLPDSRYAVVSVFVSNDLLNHDVVKALLALLGVGVALVVVAIAVGDRLGQSLVRSVQALSTAAVRLGEGDLSVRVAERGPAELGEVGDAFNDLVGRVGEQLSRERELIADLSHRLRTPLTALRLDVDAVRDGELHARLDGHVDALHRTVDELIAQARRSHRTNEASPIDINDLTRDRVDFWSVLAEEQQRPWAFDPAHGPCLVKIDPDDYVAALDVLIENVFSHTPDRCAFGVRVKAGDTVSVAVFDDGPGVREELVERGQSGGASTGLGLDIARRTAEDADGELVLAPRPSGGTVIEMRFPSVGARPRSAR